MTDMGMGGLSSMGGMSMPQTPQIQTGNTTPAVQSQPTVDPNTANAMGGTVQTQPGQAAPQSQPPVQTAQTNPQQTSPLQKMMQGGQKQGGGGGGGGGGQKGQGGDQKKEQQQSEQSQQKSMAAPQQPQPNGGEHQGLMAALNAGQGPNYWKGMFPEATQGSPVVPRPGDGKKPAEAG